jgi:hypothetical protein
VFGEPAIYEKLSDREARFAAICLGSSNFHFSRLLSGSERTIAPVLVLRQPADLTRWPLLVDSSACSNVEDWQMVGTMSPPAWSSRFRTIDIEDPSSRIS